MAYAEQDPTDDRTRTPSPQSGSRRARATLLREMFLLFLVARGHVDMKSWDLNSDIPGLFPAQDLPKCISFPL